MRVSEKPGPAIWQRAPFLILVLVFQALSGAIHMPTFISILRSQLLYDISFESEGQKLINVVSLPSVSEG